MRVGMAITTSARGTTRGVDVRIKEGLDRGRPSRESSLAPNAA